MKEMERMNKVQVGGGLGLEKLEYHTLWEEVKISKKQETTAGVWGGRG